MSGRIEAAIAAAAMALAPACGGRALAPERTAESAPQVPPSAAPAPSASPNPAPSGPSPAEAEREIATALADAARIRELAPRGPVRGQVLSRGVMGAHVRENIAREVPPEVVSGEADMLVSLGVVPTTFDYTKAIVELMTAELAGYYEPADKTMYLAADLGEPERRATLAHELVHALQDQYYALGPLLDYRPDASDVQAAVHSLAEGDAMSAMLDQLLEAKGQKATDLPEAFLAVQARAAAQFSKAVKDIPEILKRSLIAPYVDGLAFVHDLRRRGGWSEVDRIWHQLPESTEQLLHPDKLLGREHPITVAVPVAPPSGPVTVSLHDVLGEQALRILFEEWLARRPAAAAAADWGGDRVAVFRDETRVATAIHVRYDNETGAALGFAAFKAGIQAQGGPSTVSRNRSCVERGDRGPLLAMVSKREVVVVAGPYAAAKQPTSASDCRSAALWADRVAARR